MTEATTDPNVGRVLAGQFRIDALLGQGGMGTVYRGIQLSVTRPVAIKLIAGSAPNQAELVKRFRREAEATARLSHPNTVRLFDFGVTESQELYMVMELLSGSDLSVHLQERGALPLTDALLITRQVLQALAEAHALGVVHRDLKPGNVFLAQVHGGEMVAKVMDFGIAGIEQARETQKLTMTGAVMGTPAYMSPEQAQGQPVDARSDLYSLGVMLFEMLTGRPPFQADTVVSLLLAHVTKPPPRLFEVQPNLAQLERAQQLLDRLLAKLPDERLPSAAAALEAIAALTGGSPAALPLRTSSAAGFAPTAVAAATSPETPMGWTVSQAAPPKRASSARPLIVGVAAALLAAAGYFVLRPVPAPQPSAASANQPNVPSETNAAETLHSVTIASAPKGASVLLDGAELGKTPYTLQFRHDAQLQVTLRGYAPAAITVTRDSDPNLVVELVPQSRVALNKAAETQAAAPQATNPTPAAAPNTAAIANPPAVQIAEPPPAPTHNDRNAAQRAAATPPPAAQPQAEEPSASPTRAPGQARRPTPVRQVTRAVGGLIGSIFGRDDQHARREGMLRGAPPYPSVSAAQRAYNSGSISAEAYEDAIWVLKMRRKQRIETEKANLKTGAITSQEYEWRLSRIDAEFQGQ